MTGIGVNVHRWDGAVADALLEIQPPLIVASNPDWDILARCRASFPTAIIYRHILPGNPDAHGVDPTAFAAAALDAVAPYRHLVAAVQGYNEAIGAGNVVEQAARELAFVRAVQGQGVPVVALNAAVGNLEPEHIPLLLDLWREAAAVGYHGYVREFAADVDPPEWPWHLRRPEALWLPVLQRHGLDLSRMVLTETGTFHAPFPSLSPEAYAVLCCRIADYARGVGMMGTAAFTLSAWEPWQTVQPWELVGTEAVGVFAEYNRRHGGQPPVFRIPSKAAPKPAPATRSITVPSNIPVAERLTANFTQGRREYRTIFLHATRGPGDRSLEAEYRATVNYFLRDGTASAHFVVGPSSVTRMVRDGDGAWHARENNAVSLAIEIAQPSTQPEFTDFQYEAVAAICAAWCDAYGIPRRRVMSQYERGIIGHEDSEQGKADGKSDPGPKWDWDRFLALLNGDREGEDELTEAQKATIRAELDKYWHIAGLLDSISAHDIANTMRESAVSIKQAAGLE